MVPYGSDADLSTTSTYNWKVFLEEAQHDFTGHRHEIVALKAGHTRVTVFGEERRRGGGREKTIVSNFNLKWTFWNQIQHVTSPLRIRRSTAGQSPHSNPPPAPSRLRVLPCSPAKRTKKNYAN